MHLGPLHKYRQVNHYEGALCNAYKEFFVIEEERGTQSLGQPWVSTWETGICEKGCWVIISIIIVMGEK